MSTETKPQAKPLRIDQTAAIEAYANPNSPTFGNKARSWIATHPRANSIQGSSTSLNQLLTKPEATSLAEKILRQNGYGFEVRVSDIAEAAAGHAPPDVIKTTTTDAEGKVTESVTERPVPHTARLGYQKLLMQLTGATEQAKAIGRAQGRDFVDAQRSIMRRIRSARPGYATDRHESDEDAHQATAEAIAIDRHQEDTDEPTEAFVGKCLYCHTPLPAGSHHLRRYCDDRCKEAAAIQRQDESNQRRRDARARIAKAKGLHARTPAREPGARGEAGPSPSISSPSSTPDPKNLTPLLQAISEMTDEEKAVLRELLGETGA